MNKQPQTWIETVIRFNGKPIPVQVVNRTEDLSVMDVKADSEAAKIPVGAPFDYMVRGYSRSPNSAKKPEMQIMKNCLARINKSTKIDESTVRLNLDLK